jgi:hypothetical protein
MLPNIRKNSSPMKTIIIVVVFVTVVAFVITGSFTTFMQAVTDIDYGSAISAAFKSVAKFFGPIFLD